MLECKYILGLRKIYDPLFVDDFVQKYGQVKSGEGIDLDLNLYPTSDSKETLAFYDNISDKSVKFDSIREMFNPENFKDSFEYLERADITFTEFKSICEIMYARKNYTLTAEDYKNVIKTFDELYYTFNQYVIFAINYLNEDKVYATISDFKLYKEKNTLLELPTLVNIDKQIRTISDSGLSTYYTEELKKMLLGEIEYTNETFVNALSAHVNIFRKANIPDYEGAEFKVTPAMLAIYNNQKG